MASPRIALAHNFALASSAEQTPTKTKVKFDAAFLDRRMREHREFQERLAAQLESDIVHEVITALGRVQ